MKKVKITLEDLASMIQKSLLNTEENIKKEIKSVHEGLKSEITDLKTELKADIKNIKADLNKKVDIFTHKDLEYRVEKLEEKAVAGRKK